jgi:hypothetical protein
MFREHVRVSFPLYCCPIWYFQTKRLRYEYPESDTPEIIISHDHTISSHSMDNSLFLLSRLLSDNTLVLVRLVVRLVSIYSSKVEEVINVYRNLTCAIGSYIMVPPLIATKKPQINQMK